MANQKLNIDIVAKDKSKQALSNVQKGLSRLKQSVFNLKNAFIGLGAGLVVKGFIDAGIQVENLSVQLKTLFGSAQEGEKALRSITKFAATTPFELKNIQQGVTSLAVVRKQAEAAGLSFDDLLTLTGNVAAQMGGDFAFASFQIQKAFSTGIAAAESLKERGVAGMAGFKAGVSVNAMDTIKIMNKAFGKGGEFGNLMEELSKTLFGTISNLKDAFFIFQVGVSKGFFDTLKSNLGDLKKTIEDNSKEIAEFGLMIGSGLSTAISGTAKFLKFLKDNIDAITVAFRIFIALKVVSFFHNLAIAIGVANGAMLGFNATVRKNLLIGAAVATIASLDIIIAKLKVAAEFMGLINGKETPKPDEDKGNNDAELVKKFAKMETLSEAIDRNFKDVFISFREANETVINDMQGKLSIIGQTIGKSLSGGIKNFSDAFARSVILGEKLSESFKKMAQQLGVKILSALIEILARKSVELAIEKLITREKQKQAMLSTTNALSGLGSLKGFFGMAKGGAVSKGQPYVVGENGPEMFIPNSTGQITQNARGTGNGGATTVNFNINTVDASGFEELLVRSRGTITQLINNAVNERGSKNLI
jgi:hypothetical protein